VGPPEATERIVHVVDDDANILRAVARLLRSHSYTVKTYSSASEFRDTGIPVGPACLLLDLMPEISGLDLQQVMSEYQSRLSIVFLSGQGDLPTAVRAMKAGAVDFVTKPFEGDALIAAIDSALSRSHSGQALEDAVQKDWELFQTLSRRERQVFVYSSPREG
jgi:FixJ family two-component response regulator